MKPSVLASAAPAAEPRRMMLHLAQNVTAARRAAQLTQRELAEAAELSRATVHLIEAGASDPRVSTIVLLARALNVPPLRLLERRPPGRERVPGAGA